MTAIARMLPWTLVCSAHAALRGPRRGETTSRRSVSVARACRGRASRRDSQTRAASAIVPRRKAGPMSLVLYHHPFTRAANVVWMLEEVGAPYELRFVDVRKGAHKAPDILALNGMGKLPILTDGDAVVT